MSSAISIKNGFLLAGLINIISPLVTSKFFTDENLSLIDPEAFSILGLILVMLWGLAYCSVANNWKNNPALIMVFAIEKLLYAFYWIYWSTTVQPNFSSFFSESFFIGLFYSSYGLLDAIFATFFLFAFWKANKAFNSSDKTCTTNDS